MLLHAALSLVLLDTPSPVVRGPVAVHAAPAHAGLTEIQLSPNGGETLQAGQTHHITWVLDTQAADVRLEYSVDDGASWSEIVSTTPEVSGDYPWVVPDVPSAHARVRIREVPGGAVLAQSNNTFSIFRAPNGLIASYLFNGNAQDGTGNGNHGAIHGAVPTADRFDHWDNAYSFSGFSSSIEVSRLPVPLTDDFTIAFWEKSSETYLMEALGLGSDFEQSLDFFFNEAPYASMAIWNPLDGTFISTYGAPLGSFTDGAWHHILLKRAGSVVNLYVDGGSVGTAEYTGTIGAQGPLKIGRGSYGTGWFAGSIDDVLIYNRALDDEEIAALSGDKPVVSLVLPAAGDRWQAGTSHDITWQAAPGVTEVTLEFSADNGATWTGIVASSPAEPGRYSWTVPDMSSRICLLRISGEASGNVVARAERAWWVIRGTSQPWELITPHAAFEPRDGAGPVVFDGYMWLLGGWNGKGEVGNDVWRSRDGANWEFVTKAPWPRRHAFGSVIHDNRMWVIGGDGLTDVWSSPDGRTWTLATEEAPWGPRYKPYVIAFDGKIWLMGGPDVFHGRYVPYNDVWNTTDGVTWTRVIEHAPWSPRGIIHGAVVFNGRMWIMGGGLYGPPPTFYPEVYYNDVWSSADGVNWESATGSAPWSPRIHHTIAAYAGKLWVMAGHDFDLYGTGVKNDVWVSSDGVSWHELSGTPWSPRHAATLFVYDDALWLVAGYLVNDVWRIRLPGAISIADGAIAIETTSVVLHITAPSADVVAMQFSNDGLTWSEPQPYAEQSIWTLSAGDGIKTVYVRFRNSQGGWSDAFSDTILYSSNPYLKLSSPIGGESWQVGSQRQITWIAGARVSRVRLDYSLDDGATWHEMIASVPAADGAFAWTVPNVASGRSRVRIASADGQDVTDESPEPFWMFRAPGGLVAHYPFGGNAQDASGNANHGVVHGATLSADRFGVPGGAYRMDGSSSFIDVARLPVSLAADFTIAYWVRSSNHGPMQSLGLGDAEGANLDFSFNADPFGFFVYWNGSGANAVWNDSTTPGGFADSRWHHVLMERAGAEIGVYMDGTLVGTAPYIGTIGDRGPLQIGRGSYTGYWWDGSIDDVRIYNRALDADEIRALSHDEVVITTQPLSQTIASGQSAMLSVEATGTLPLDYQWYLGTGPDATNPIAGAVASTYATPPLTSPASYWVRVSNPYGGPADSTTAAIIIGTPPAIAAHPQSQTIASGQSVTLRVEATGSAPLSYQWYADSSPNTTNPIAGATSSSYTTPAATSATSYWVRVSSPYGSPADSSTASLTIGAPTVTVPSSRVTPGGALTALVAFGPGNATDWVGLFACGAADSSYADWSYLNGLRSPPAVGVREATRTFTAPLTPGCYDVRWFSSNSYARLATSGPVTVPGEPAVTADAQTVDPGAQVTFTVTDGPGNPTDWVGLFSCAAPAWKFLDWSYLNGRKSAPPEGATESTGTFTAPLTGGCYNIRLFSNNGYGWLATSSPVTVPHVPFVTAASPTVTPGGTIQFTVANAPGNLTDWVGLFSTTATDSAYLTWVYLSGSTTPPDSAPTEATLSLQVPAAPDSYNIRLFANNSMSRLATSGTITAQWQPALTISNVTVGEGSSGASTATFTVTLAPASADTVTVDYATADGTAIAGSDYEWSAGTLVFPAGTSTQTVSVIVNGDATPEDDETFLVNLTNAVNAVVDRAQGLGTILNDDAPSAATVTPALAMVSEGGRIGFTVANGPGNANDWVGLYQASAGDSAYLAWQYLNGSQTPPATGLSGATLQFTAPAESGDYNIRLFQNNSMAGLATSSAVTVQPMPTLTISDVILAEGNAGTSIALFTVTLAPGSTQTVTVDYSTANGTATAGIDYVATSGTVTFAPGVTTQPITVVVTGDTAPEPGETFFVNLTNATNAAIGDSRGQGTISNDDGAIGLDGARVGARPGDADGARARTPRR